MAIKTLKEGIEENKIEFLQEAVTMAQFKHLNVIYLYGVAHEGENVSNSYIVGSLYGYGSMFIP